MATAWNLKKVHEILNNNIKTDVNNICVDLKNIDSAVEELIKADQNASSKNGTTISRFSGHKAYAYFNVLKKKNGYYENSEKFYKKVYKLCTTLVDRGQQRAIKDNNSKYKSYTKWSSTLPANKSYQFNHVIPSTVSEDVTNVCSNIYTLKDSVDRAYNSYIKHTQLLANDLKTLKKYTPDGLDKKIAAVIKSIESRNNATTKRKNQLGEYINSVVLQYLMENMRDEQSMSGSGVKFDDSQATQTID